MQYRSAYADSKSMIEPVVHLADTIYGVENVGLLHLKTTEADPSQSCSGKEPQLETHHISLTVDATLGRHSPLDCLEPIILHGMGCATMIISILLIVRMLI